MIKHDPLGFEKMKEIRDGLTVRVIGGDIEQAIRLLHRKVREVGILRALKVRRDNPTAKGRKSVKALRALRHRERYWARKAAAAARDTR